MEAVWGHSNHGQRLAVEPDGYTGNVGIGMEPGLPQTLADHHHRVSTLLVAVFFGVEEPAKDGPDPEHREEIPGNQLAADALGMLVLTEAHRFRPGHGQAGEQLQVVAIVPVVGVGDGGQVLAGGATFSNITSSSP